LVSRWWTQRRMLLISLSPSPLSSSLKMNILSLIVELAGSPLLVAVDSDGNAEVVGPLVGVEEGAPFEIGAGAGGEGDDDFGGTRVGKGALPTEAAPIDSPFGMQRIISKARNLNLKYDL
jgi:hypothetical protein